MRPRQMQLAIRRRGRKCRAQEAGRVLLRQPVQRGLLRAVTLGVQRGLAGRPLGLSTTGVDDPLAMR